MTPYYEDGHVTLFHGDCLEVMPTLAPVDIVVTSPPYNMGATPGGNGRGLYVHTTQKAKRFGDGYSAPGDDGMDPAKYDEWQRACLATMWELATGAVFYNHRPRIIHGAWTAPLGFDFGGIPLRQIITWDRKTGIDVNLRHFCTRGEWILLFARPEFSLVDHAASGMGDVWRLGMESGSEHPAPFPESLPARCIAASGADSVLDPFAGSGTTLVAAKRAGVRAIGVEKSERFCEMAAERLCGPIRSAEGTLFGATA